MDIFNLEVLSAERRFYKGTCSSLIVPAYDGLYGIEAKHSNVVMALVPGLLTFTDGEGKKNRVVTGSGFMKVEGGDALVVVDTAELPEEIDMARAQQAADESKEALLTQQSKREYHEYKEHLARAMNRLRLGRKSSEK